MDFGWRRQEGTEKAPKEDYRRSSRFGCRLFAYALALLVDAVFGVSILTFTIPTFWEIKWRQESGKTFCQLKDVV